MLPVRPGDPALRRAMDALRDREAATTRKQRDDANERLAAFRTRGRR